jgi:CheY-like chemotaxis protein
LHSRSTSAAIDRASASDAGGACSWPHSSPSRYAPKILVLIAYAMKGDGERARDAGADGYLVNR